MTSNKRIQNALNLNQDTGEIHRYYDEWPSHYDQDVTSEHYCGPDTIARMATALYQDENGNASISTRQQARVLDAGCVTGLARVEFECIKWNGYVSYGRALYAVLRPQH